MQVLHELTTHMHVSLGIKHFLQLAHHVSEQRKPDFGLKNFKNKVGFVVSAILF
jgi:hypothetical protein